MLVKTKLIGVEYLNGRFNVYYFNKDKDFFKPNLVCLLNIASYVGKTDRGFYLRLVKLSNESK